MRKYNKFKVYTNFYKFFYFFPSRIFNFKRPKWLKVQKSILKFKSFFFKKKKIKRKVPKNVSLLRTFYTEKYYKFKPNRMLTLLFFNFFIYKCNLYKWEYLKKKLRFFYLHKTLFLAYFDGQFLLKKLKTLFRVKNRLFSDIQLFIKPEYRLDIILWRLKFFSSVYIIKYALKKNLISVNFNIIKQFIYLQKGDIVNVKFNKFSKIKNNIETFLKIPHLYVFVEIDYYSQTFVIIKSYKSYLFKNLSSIIRYPFNTLSLKNFRYF